VTTAPASPPPGDWAGMNILDPDELEAIRRDPHPFLHRLRARDPVNRTPIGTWRLTRHRDVVRLLREAPVGVRRSDGSLWAAARNPERSGPSEFMLQQDPPEHTRLRKLVSRAFTPRAVERLRHRAQTIADDCVARGLERGEMDVIRELALPVPATMICEMMGVPTSDRDRFTQWTSHATHLLASATAAPEVLERGHRAADALSEYFEGLIAERRKALGDDILSNLIRAEAEGDRLSPSELLSQSIGLLIAGFETTIGLIGNGVRALLQHPGELARLRADPELLPSAVEECLRFDGPIPLTIRIMHEDFDFGEHVIPRDDVVMGMLAGANRDPEAFPEPDRFDVGRRPNPHLAFGGGAHLCLGAHLARMEGQVAIGTLVRRARELELLEADPPMGESLFRVRARLPVALG